MQCHPRPADLLLGDHDRVEAPPADVEREAAELADRVANAVEQLGVLAHDELGPKRTAGLLVGEQAQDHVAGRLQAARLGTHERGEHHRDTALHVERATTPQVAVGDLAGEWSVLPLAARGDDVDVPLQQQRRARAAARQPRDQVRALGILRDDARLDAERVEQPSDPRDALTLGAWRVARVEPEQVLQQLSWSVLEAIARHRRQSRRSGQPAGLSSSSRRAPYTYHTSGM